MRKTNYNENMYGDIEHEQMESLISALHNNKVLLIEKDLLNTANTKLSAADFPLKFHPMELVFHRGRVCIAGMDAGMKFMSFTVDKNFIFTKTKNIFNRKKFEKTYTEFFKKMYGISSPINEKLYHIKIEFTESYGDSFKSFFWHESLQWKKLANGHYMLHLHCSIGRELIGFLAIGLSKVKVHSPAILKNLILKKFQECIDLYQDDKVLNEDESNRGL